MTRVKLVLEGQTEREFVRDVLGPYVAERTDGRVQLITAVLITSVTERTHRGGTGHDYALVRRNIINVLRGGGAEAFSSMLDVYRVPTKNRPWDVAPRPADPLAWVARLEERFRDDIGDWRFRPYLCLHVFEAMLLTSPDHLVREVSALAPHLDEMHSLLRARGTPEHINDGPDTAPAKRLDRWSGGAYRKPLHGLSVSRAIGIDEIRRACLHFNDWVTWLLSLGHDPSIPPAAV